MNWNVCKTGREIVNTVYFFTLLVEPLCVHGFACASMWMFLFCLSVPGRSHSVTFRRLTLPTSCVLCKQKLLPFPALQQVTHAFCHFCRQRITMNLQLQERKKTTSGTTQDSYTSTRIPGNNEAPRVRGEEDEEESAPSFLLLFPAFGFKVSLALTY